jgi:DNA polymerase-3 subunit delta
VKAAAPVVYIYGDETFLIDRALDEISAEALAGGDPALNRQVFDAREAAAAEVVVAAQTMPFLGGRRLVVVKSAERWSATEWKGLLSYLESPNPATCLVFVATRLDRRLAAGKLLAKVARLVECRNPRENELLGWAGKLSQEAGLRPSPEVLQALVLRVGPDLQLMSQEIEKLRVFAGEGGEVTETDVEDLVGENRGTTVFALCDALGARDLAGAVRALRRLLLLGEPPAKLLVMIVRHFRHLWIGREMLDTGRRPNSKSAAATMGVHPFAAEKALRQARGWEEPELRQAFELFVRSDVSLKTGGGAEVLDTLLLDLCQAKRKTRLGASRDA